MKVQLFGKKILRGVSTLEILIAFAVLSLSLSAVIMLVFSNQSVAVDTQTNIEALSKAQAGLEQARAAGKQNFDSVVSIPPAADDIYQKSLTVDILDPLIKKVTSTITWTESGRPLSIALTTLLTNYSGGNTCSPTISGDWSAPQVYAYVDFVSSAGATGVDAQGAKTYISSNPSSAGTDDFYVIDTSDVSPGKGVLPILGKFSTSFGLSDVKANGNYAYVAAVSGVNQLLVIDVTTPAALSPSKIVAQRDVTAPGDTAVGNTLFYANKKLYVGLTKSNGKEFRIFDVTNPANPIEQGTGYETNSKINSIFVKNNIAYLAVADTNQLIALDVSNAANPTLINKYTPGPTALFGQSLAVNGSNVYLGRTGPNANPKLLAFSTANVSTPLWTMNMSGQSGVYTAILRGSLLFLTTADPNDGLQIWDISAASASVQPTRFDTSPLNIQQTSTAGTDCYGNLLFVAQRSQRALQVVGPFVSSSYTLGSSGDQTVIQGAVMTNVITATLQSGPAQNIGFTVSGAPTGAATSFSPTSCTISCNTTLNITPLPSTPEGTYPITVTGTGGVTTTFNIVVTLAPFNYTVTNSGDINVKQGNSGAVTITATKTQGATQPVTFTVASSPALPASVVQNLSSNSCGPTCTSNITFTPGNDPATKNKSYTITVTAASAGLPNKTTTFVLKVQP